MPTVPPTSGGFEPCLLAQRFMWPRMLRIVYMIEHGSTNEDVCKYLQIAITEPWHDHGWSYAEHRCYRDSPFANLSREELWIVRPRLARLMHANSISEVPGMDRGANHGGMGVRTPHGMPFSTFTVTLTRFQAQSGRG